MKLKLLLPFYFCLLPCFLSGQITEEIDSVNKVALNISKEYPDSCIRLSKWAIRLSDSLDYKPGLASGYECLGAAYLWSDSLYQAMINYLKAQREYEQLEPSTGLYTVYVILSWINKFTGRTESVIPYERKAIKVLRQLDPIEYQSWLNIDLAHRHNHIGRAYMDLGIYDSTIYYNEIAMSYADTATIPWFCNTYGRLYQRKFIETRDTSYLDKAVEWFMNGLENPLIGDDQSAVLHSNLFHAYFAYGDEEMDRMALYHTKMVMPRAIKNPDAFYTIPSYWQKFGRLMERKGKYDSAIYFYDKSLKIIDSALSNYSMTNYSIAFYALNNRYWHKMHKKDAYYYLYDVYNTIGDHEKALEYYIKYKNAKEDIYKEETKNLVALLEAESENEKVQNRISTLERDKIHSQMKAAQTRNLNIAIVAIFVVLLLLGILLFRQKKLKDEQKNTLLEQKLLRLQMNPHFIFNALSSIRSLMSPEDIIRAKDYLGNFSRLLRSSLEASREDNILLEDEISSLKNYLEIQRLRYNEKFNYTIDIDTEIDPENAILPPMLLQPFVENAIEHGIKHKEGQGNIHIRFKLANKKLSCEIEDDGVGREKAWEVEYAEKGKHKSLATEIILDRIKILNKKLRQKIMLVIIDKKPETEQSTGTIVRLDLPYILD